MATATEEDKVQWNKRFTEHWYFLALLIDRDLAPELKNYATVKYQEWAKTPESHTMEQLQELKQFKIQLLKRQDSKQIVGMIFPSLLEHMLMELSYFVNLIEGQLTVQDELDFFLEEGSQHTALAAHLIDPQHKQLVLMNLEMAQTLDEQIGQPPSSQLLQLVQTANSAAVDLLGSISRGEVKALLTPLMLQHEIAEAQLGAKKLAMALQLQ